MTKYILLVIFLAASALSFGQETGGVWGHISDAELEDEPMLFANVQLKGTSRSVQTNFHGNFEFSDLQPGSHTLVVQYLGYERKEIPFSVQEGLVTHLESSLSKRKYVSKKDIGTDIATKSLGLRTSSGQN